jgi:hypothetical protein
MEESTVLDSAIQLLRPDGLNKSANKAITYMLSPTFFKKNTNFCCF